MSTTLCIGCGAGAVSILLDLGEQPPSNRFLSPDAAEQDRHPLVVGQCGSCALLQLINPMPATMAKSRFDWLTYNEPEGHLDSLVGYLRTLEGVSPSSRIHGLTYKDDSTLSRLARSGFGGTFRYELAGDLGVEDRCAGLETIQEVMTDDRAERLCRAHGSADMLIVRHVLEHAHEPASFLDALGRLVKPGGYIVFEVPDCRKFVGAKDYSFIWEEHIAYFSPDTVARFARRHGYEVVRQLTYPYPLEDSLVLILRRNAAGQPITPGAGDGQELGSGREFAQGFEAIRRGIHALLGGLRRGGQRIAVFGAGHLAAKFLNLYGLADHIDCVVDDHPRKQGLSMPGSRLPILGSSALTERKIDLCLLSLSPESEARVLAAKRDYVSRGGRFASIFALSPNVLRPELVP